MFRSRQNEPIETLTASSLSNGNASIIKKKCIQNEKDLSKESMDAIIAAIAQLSAFNGTTAPSSLSLGNASIIPPISHFNTVATPTATNTTVTNTSPKKRQFSLFSWKKPSLSVDSLSISSSSDEDSSLPCSPRNSITASPKDDGKDDLQCRGIHVKEIKTTMNTLVVSDNVRNPMPQVKLERPSFARINY